MVEVFITTERGIIFFNYNTPFYI